MRAIVRSNARLVTVVLSALALGLVFGSVFRLVPAGPIPRYPGLLELVPHLNAVISLLAIGTIVLGVRSIRAGNVASHRRLMVASTLLFTSFLVLYLYKLVLEGTTVFRGPAVLKQFVYLPLLGVHVLLAVVAVPLVIYAILLATTHSVAELPTTPHPRVGRLAAAFWLISFTLGLVIYVLLYLAF